MENWNTFSFPKDKIETKSSQKVMPPSESQTTEVIHIQLHYLRARGVKP